MRSEEEKEIELRAESKKPSEEGNKEEKEIELRAESKEPSKEGSKEVQQELNMILDDISSDESDIEFKESDQSQLDQAECKPERLVLSAQMRKTRNYSAGPSYGFCKVSCTNPVQRLFHLVSNKSMLEAREGILEMIRKLLKKFSSAANKIIYSQLELLHDMVKPKQVPDNLKCYSKILKTYLKRVMITSRPMRVKKDKTFLNYVKNHLGYNGNSVLIKALR